MSLTWGYHATIPLLILRTRQLGTHMPLSPGTLLLGGCNQAPWGQINKKPLYSPFLDTHTAIALASEKVKGGGREKWREGGEREGERRKGRREHAIAGNEC